MYPFERFLRTLKNKIKNPRYVEGSIAEAYLVEEAAKFASYYYPPEMMSRWRGVPRNDDAGDTRDQKSIFNFPGHKIVKAGAGRSHTVVVTEDGHSLAFGWNKHGQLEIESSPVRCLVSEVSYATCGGDFTVWLSSVEGSSILTAGLPQYGQLGHGTDNEYNSKDSSVRLVYEAQPCPRAVAKLSGETIVKVACGTNHTGCYFVLFLLHLIVACGMGHSMVIVDGTNVGERLCQLDIYDGKASGEVNEEPVKKAPAPNCRVPKRVQKGEKETSGSNSSRAKGKAKGSDAGRNRSPVKTGKRGRPRKS
ncbi:hypothetical protein K1719_029104 [Acacia pycnantha]|nr:hypothetical protein K1719_029104 [Acacia pycnantha]